MTIDALEQIDDWPARAAVAVIDPDGIIASRGPVDEEFGLASVTKPLTGALAMLLVQERMLLLDEPVTAEGATVRHLLSHAGGLAAEMGGPIRPPEDRRVYSNWGWEILAARVEDELNESVADALRNELLDPLGMSATVLRGSAAHAAVATVTDLAAFARELLAPKVLEQDTVTDMATIQFPTLAGILPGYGRQNPNPWGLGVEIRGDKSPHWTGLQNSPQTFGHFGQSGSFIWVDPTIQLACVSLADSDFGAWAIEAWPALADAVIDQHA